MAIELNSETPVVQIPRGYKGPVVIPGTGREVYWTGRVAIGLRHEAPRRVDEMGSQAMLVQKALLRRG